MTEDTRDYATCPHAITDPDAPDAEGACGEPIQATVERWYNVLTDGALVIEPTGGAAGGGMIRIYCAEDHELGEYDAEPIAFESDGTLKPEFVRECLAEYEVTTASRGDGLDAGDDSAIPGSERAEDAHLEAEYEDRTYTED